MKIILDDIIYALQKNGGITKYWEYVTSAIALNFTDVLRLNRVNKFGRVIPLRSSFERYLPAKSFNSDILFSSYYRIPDNADTKYIVSVYDFIYERYIFGLRGFIHKTQKFNSLKRADEIICISNSTKSDLLDFYPDIPENKISVIHLGVNTVDFFNLNIYRDNSKPFILYVGSRVGYKNFELLIKSIVNLNLHLIIIGGGALRENELRLLSESRVHYTHFLYCSNSDLNYFYNISSCLVYPSSYEGFGLPIIEAQSANCPVIIPEALWSCEVSGNLAVFFRNNDSENLRNILRCVSFQGRGFFPYFDYSENMAKFTWNACIEETLKIFKKYT